MDTTKPPRVPPPSDRRRYDSLRTLTSELERILRDGGSVQIGIGRGHWLPAKALRAALRWL